MGYVDPNDGHRVGAVKIKDLLRWCEQAGIRHVTLYLLGTENLRRPAAELDPLLRIIEDLAGDLAAEGNPWELRTVGRARRAAGVDGDRAEGGRGGDGRPGRRHDRQHGGRLRWPARDRGRGPGAAASSTRRSGGTLEELAEVLDVDHIAEHLYTKGQPDPDLVIRTSGEQRLSGFLLWQSAHSEFYFCDVNWPDFRRVDFLRALRSYANRQRRFGA